ncbi:MAG TPA: type 4a pilus biogenesis protein PilO [Actinomycetota bacterium]|nr:type 4a pilus biogenesis protein PilO [Actinomycetota bacterium]
MNRRAPIIAGAVGAILVVLSVVLLVLPKMGEVGETQDRLEAAQDQETSLEGQLRALQEAEAQAPETERQIDRIEDQVPPTADLPALFRLLQGAADRSAVDFFSFSPGTPVPDATGTFSVIASQITVSGGYFALDEFLFLLETLQRAAKVTSITVAPQGEAGTVATSGSAQLQLQMTVEFFTTDASAGPGSVPGPTEGAPAAGGA